MIKVLFLCHGSICRSPAAMCYGRARAEELGLGNRICFDAKALSLEEIGNPIYPPMRRTLEHAGIKLYPHIASQVRQEDIDKSDYVFAMDEENFRYAGYVLTDTKKIKRIGIYTENDIEIEDPWYTDRYDLVLRQIKECVDSIIAHILDSDISFKGK